MNDLSKLINNIVLSINSLSPSGCILVALALVLAIVWVFKMGM